MKQTTRRMWDRLCCRYVCGQDDSGLAEAQEHPKIAGGETPHSATEHNLHKVHVHLEQDHL